MERNLQRFSSFARSIFAERPIRVIVEAGARDGRETRDLCAQFPQARVISLECNPHTLPQCRSAVADLPQATLIEKAVSDRNGTITFYPIDTARTVTGDAAGNPGASSLFLASGSYELEQYVQNEITVETVSLASLVAEYQLPAIDLLWMDIQGAELMALSGLGEHLNDVSLIHTEVEFTEVYSGQPLFAEIAGFLAQRGFAFVGFTIYAKHSADAVFVNRRLFPAYRIALSALRHRLLLKKRLTYLRHRGKRALLGRT